MLRHRHMLTFQVAHAISIRIQQTPRINLIENGIIPPSPIFDLGKSAARKKQEGAQTRRGQHVVAVCTFWISKLFI